MSHIPAMDPLSEAYGLALQLHHAGQHEACAAACQMILDGWPGQLESLLLLGVSDLEIGNLAQARRAFEAILAIREDWADPYYNLGLVAKREGHLEQALICYEKALAIRPDWPEASQNMGNLLKGLGRPAEAIEAFRKAVAVKREFAPAWWNLAETLSETGRLAESAESYGQLLSLEPENWQALNHCGLVLLAMGRPQEALANFDRSIAVKPDYAVALNNRGTARLALRQVPEALVDFERAIALNREYAHAHYNRGNALQDLGRFDDAISAYDYAVSIDSEYAEAHWNKGLCQLMQGNYAAGWPGFEWRFDLPGNPIRPTLPEGPRWQGQTLAEGARLLVFTEQGLGDTLQFCRFLNQTALSETQVVLEVQPSLVELMQYQWQAFDVIAQGAPRPAFDAQCSLLSLPQIFTATSGQVAPSIPYLRADPERHAIWLSRLGQGDKPRVGLVWRGRAPLKNGRDRSVGLSRLRPLVQYEGIEFVSLQNEVRPDEEAILAELPIRDFRDELRDFSDTAALASVMDLVITIDTSVAHLAGGLGLPLWVMLVDLPDWRWMIDREDSPWYPSARLFRQRAEGDWDGVVDRLQIELRNWLRQMRP